MKDQAEMIMEYEQGNQSFQETIKMFQDLLDSALVWDLQGHYGRTARELIRLGYIKGISKQKQKLIK